MFLMDIKPLCEGVRLLPFNFCGCCYRCLWSPVSDLRSTVSGLAFSPILPRVNDSSMCLVDGCFCRRCCRSGNSCRTCKSWLLSITVLQFSGVSVPRSCQTCQSVSFSVCQSASRRLCNFLSLLCWFFGSCTCGPSDLFKTFWLIIGAHAPKWRQNGEIPVRNFVKNIFVMTNTKKSEVYICNLINY